MRSWGCATAAGTGVLVVAQGELFRPAKESFVGGCRCVTGYDQFVRDINDAEEAGHPVHQVQQARDPCCLFG